jgi:hypothetical protein
MGMGGGSGGGRGLGGGFAGETAEAAAMRKEKEEEENARVEITRMAAMLAEENSPANQKIHKKLEEPISMSFANPTPVEDVLKYIKSATQGPKDQGIPVYVDPEGLAEVEKTLTSPVQLDLEGVPLKTTLRLMLKQLGLAYCVKDGVLMISSVKGILQELKEAKPEAGGLQ